MTNNDLNAGGGAADTELEVEKPEGDDPFDKIEDEGLRADAKKYRAIATRKSEKKEPVVEKKVEPVVVHADTSDFLKKSDVAKLALQEAKDLVSDEVKEHWDELIAIPLAGYDNLSAKSIAQNMADRLVIWEARNPSKEKKEDVSDLKSTSANATGGGQGGDKSIPKKDPPNFHLPLQPKDWYKAPPSK